MTVSIFKYFQTSEHFTSMDDLIKTMEDYIESSKYDPSIKRSELLATMRNKNKIPKNITPDLDLTCHFYRLEFQCEFGKKRVSSAKKPGVVCRQSKNKDMNCSFSLNFICQPKGLVITKVTEHSCQVNSTLKKYKPTEKDIETILLGSNLNAKNNKIRNLLNKKIKGNKLSTQDIINLRNKYENTNNTGIEGLKEDDRFKFIYRYNEEKKKDVIVSIIYQDADMKRVFKTYGDVIMLDSTFGMLTKLNSPWKCFFMVAINANGQGEIVSYFLTISEAIEYLNPIFQILNQQNDFSTVQTLITDKDLKERAVIKNYFPGACLIICDVHVKRIFDRKINETLKININKIPEEDKTFYPSFIFKKKLPRNIYSTTLDKTEKKETKRIIYSIIEAADENEVIELYNNISWKFREYFRKCWLHILPQFVIKMRPAVRTLGLYTTNNVEGSFGSVKREIIKQVDLLACINKINDWVDNKRMRNITNLKMELIKIPVGIERSPLNGLFKYITPHAYSLLVGIWSIKHMFPIDHKSFIIKNNKCPLCSYDLQFGLPCSHILNYFPSENQIICFIDLRWSRQSLVDVYNLDFNPIPTSPKTKITSEKKIKTSFKNINPLPTQHINIREFSPDPIKKSDSRSPSNLIIKTFNSISQIHSEFVEAASSILKENRNTIYDYSTNLLDFAHSNNNFLIPKVLETFKKLLRISVTNSGQDLINYLNNIDNISIPENIITENIKKRDITTNLGANNPDLHLNEEKPNIMSKPFIQIETENFGFNNSLPKCTEVNRSKKLNSPLKQSSIVITRNDIFSPLNSNMISFNDLVSYFALSISSEKKAYLENPIPIFIDRKEITPSSLLPLIREEAIDNTIIDSFLSILVQSIYPHKKVYVLNTFYSAFALHDNVEDCPNYFKSSCITKKFQQLHNKKSVGSQDVFTISDLEVILIPVHTPGHWTLLTIDIKRKQCFYFDSLGGGSSVAARLMSFTNRVLEKGGLNKIDFEIIPAKCNRQTGVNCGLHLCFNAYMVVMGIEEEFTPGTEKCLRDLMLAILFLYKE